jgi:adenosylmethionine-8-amino-7-oxononanoate aminotransferase
VASENTSELLKWDREHITHGRWPIGDNNGLVTEKSYGIYFEDTDGKRYIDGASQLLCVNLGYGQQEIIDAITQALQKLQYGMLFHGFSNTPIIECGRKLSELLPPGLDHFSFTTGGSESNDSAIKLARLYWHAKGSHKYKIISLYDSYHGITSGALTATGSGKGAYERGLGSHMPGFIHIPSFYCYRCTIGLAYPSCDLRCARYLGEVIEKEGADHIAAFMAEPVLGVGGMIAPPPGYWPMVAQICRENDVLLIADEVMTGFGRTGRMFAFEHWGLVPDIVTMAKGITSAYLPFGAVAFSGDIWEAVKGRNFPAYTYSGHPVCAAAAIKAMDIYQRDKVVQNAAAVGKHALERLARDFEPLPCVGEANGLGLMLGIEIVADKRTRRMFDRGLNLMQKIQDRALSQGLFVRTAGIGGTPSDRVAFAPPLTSTTQKVDEALDILHPILADITPE